MRLVYIDEAGISNAKQEPWLVVAGVVVHADNQLIAVERHLDRLMKRHIPEELQDGFVFHATELFNGGGKVFKRDDPRFPLSKRLEIASDLMATLRRFKLQIALGFVERARFPKDALVIGLKTKNQTAAAHSVAYLLSAMQVELWMRREIPSEVCMMIVEDNDAARKMIRDVQNANQRPAFAAILDESARKYFPFRKIKEDPLFQPKRQSSVLQLADACAYVFKKRLMEDERYAPFIQQMQGLILNEPAPKKAA